MIPTQEPRPTEPEKPAPTEPVEPAPTEPGQPPDQGLPPGGNLPDICGSVGFVGAAALLGGVVTTRRRRKN